MTVVGVELEEAPEGHESDLYSLNSLYSHSRDTWPTMDGAAFTGLPGEIVKALDPHTEADPVAILMTTLTVFGAAVGRGPHAVADGAHHAGRLFTVIVGETSKARKGTSYVQPRRIFFAADRRFTTERILGGFGSGEALVDAVKDGEDHRLLVVEPEWARVLSVGRREGSTLSPLLRQAWDGDRLQVRSRAAGAVTADDAHVAVLGHVTVEELRAKLVDTEVANGYANRHLFVLAKRSKLLPSGGNLEDAVVDELARKAATALGKARAIGRMNRTPAAEDLWSRLYLRMAQDEPGGLLGSVIARDAAQVLRLSVVYALCDASSSIDVQHVIAAFAVWSYCRSSAAFIFGDSLGNPLADKVLQALKDAGPDGLSGAELHRALGGHAPKAELEAARNALIRQGLVLSFTEETGGRPITVTVATECANKASKANKGGLQ